MFPCIKTRFYNRNYCNAPLLKHYHLVLWYSSMQFVSAIVKVWRLKITFHSSCLYIQTMLRSFVWMRNVQSECVNCASAVAAHVIYWSSKSCVPMRIRAAISPSAKGHCVGESSGTCYEIMRNMIPIVNALLIVESHHTQVALCMRIDMQKCTKSISFNGMPSDLLLCSKAILKFIPPLASQLRQ